MLESKRSLELRTYQKKLRRLLNKDLMDIILFGSFIKGGFARDIDIALIVKGKIDTANLKKKFYEIFLDCFY